jgi:two-component sensor histidine kinase
VIDRLHKAHSLRELLDTNKRLLQELQHRVKNHIAIIASIVECEHGRSILKKLELS